MARADWRRSATQWAIGVLAEPLVEALGMELGAVAAVEAAKGPRAEGLCADGAQLLLLLSGWLLLDECTTRHGRGLGQWLPFGALRWATCCGPAGGMAGSAWGSNSRGNRTMRGMHRDRNVGRPDQVLAHGAGGVVHTSAGCAARIHGDVDAVVVWGSWALCKGRHDSGSCPRPNREQFGSFSSMYLPFL